MRGFVTNKTNVSDEVWIIKKKVRCRICRNQWRLGRTWNSTGLHCYRRIEEYLVLVR